MVLFRWPCNHCCYYPTRETRSCIHVGFREFAPAVFVPILLWYWWNLRHSQLRTLLHDSELKIVKNLIESECTHGTKGSCLVSLRPWVWIEDKNIERSKNAIVCSVVCGRNWTPMVKTSLTIFSCRHKDQWTLVSNPLWGEGRHSDVVLGKFSQSCDLHRPGCRGGLVFYPGAISISASLVVHHVTS